MHLINKLSIVSVSIFLSKDCKCSKRVLLIKIGFCVIIDDISKIFFCSSWSISISLTLKFPCRGILAPHIILNNVDLPEPFSPVITVVVPFEKLMENWLNNGVFEFWLMKLILSNSICSIGKRSFIERLLKLAFLLTLLVFF